MKPRFTLDGSESLERRLAALCQEIGSGVRMLVPQPALEGLLLGGGYGRGEGGVLRGPTGDLPYNDLEFYVLIRGLAPVVERRYRGPLHELGERLSPAAGLEVEFKVLTRAKLRNSGPSMFYYDLLAGHRWVIGDPPLLAGCEHLLDPQKIPAHEATRLLMNRCSGLLFSRERFARAEFTPEDADFIGRNLAKIRLALGDVWLTAQGRYHWSCRERHQRLSTPGAEAPPAWLESVRREHAAGVEFKLHPLRSNESREILYRQWQQLTELARQVWLWLEARRLGQPFPSTRAYATSPLDLCPETSAGRNRLINARSFGVGALFRPSSSRYPRQRLFRSLAWLLWEPDPTNDPEVIRQVGVELGTSARDLPGLVSAYQRLWHRFN
jgi:hypothetical protein